MNSFIEAQRNYEVAREMQRQGIMAYLRDNGYNVKTRGGRGIKRYTSGGRMKPYNLNNFKYIEAERNGITYFLSLNPFDMDPNSKSRHFLPDRIGICKYKGKYNADYVYDNLQVTNIDLPLLPEDLELLKRELEVL